MPTNFRCDYVIRFIHNHGCDESIRQLANCHNSRVSGPVQAETASPLGGADRGRLAVTAAPPGGDVKFPEPAEVPAQPGPGAVRKPE